MHVDRPNKASSDYRSSRCGMLDRMGQAVMTRHAQGFTLAEVLVGSLIASIVAGGTMMALVTAARIANQSSSPEGAEANAYARETLEKFRNMIACDSPWFDPTTCAATAAMPTTWQEDPLPPAGSGGTLSILGPGAKRCYQVKSENCAGAPGDCYVIQVQVCWRGTSACQC